MRNLTIQKLQFTVTILIILMAGFVLPAHLLASDRPWDGEDHGSTTKPPSPPPVIPPELLCQNAMLNSPAPVHTKPGNYFYSNHDFLIPGQGFPLGVIRHYDSQDLYNGPFGHGWKCNLDVQFLETTDGSSKFVKIRRGDGVRVTFAQKPDGTYSPPLGRNDQLTRNSDGSFTWCRSQGCTSCGTCYHFHISGRLSYIEDANNNQTTFSYDDTDKLVKVTDASGREITIAYGPNNKITSITDHDKRTFLYGYDSVDNLTTYTDPLKNTITYAYDTKHNLISITDARGNTNIAITYDEADRVKGYSEDGESLTFTYGPQKNTTIKQDADGNRWTYIYNNTGQLLSLKDPLGHTTTYTWDDMINLTSMTDARGFTTTYTHDSHGNVLTRTDALGNTTAYTYDQTVNKVATITDPLGHITKYEYDSHGNTTKIIRDFDGVLQNETIFGYDNYGNKIKETDPLNNTTSYTYDANGNITQISDPLGNKTTYSYDSRDNRYTETDANDNVTKLTVSSGNFIESYDNHVNIIQINDPNSNSLILTYDLLGRLITVTDALGNNTTYTYDSNGNKISETDPNGNTTFFSYDAYNRPIQKTNPMGNVVSRSYDSRNNIISETDMNGNTTVFTYNILDYLISQKDPLGNTMSFTYDSNGNVITKKDANGNTITYSYDAMNRLISITDQFKNIATYTYDANGNIISTTDANRNTAQFEYDIHGRRVKYTQPMSQAVIYKYDNAGNLIAIIDEKNQKVEIGYNSNGNIVTKEYYVESDHSTPVKSVTFTHDNIGNMTGYDDGVTSAIYIYDDLNRKISETVDYGSFSLTYSYKYDQNGNKTVLTMPGGDNYHYSYNANNQIVNMQLPSLGSISYTYKGFKTLSISLPGGVTKNYSYDQLMRPLKIMVQKDIMNYQYSYDNVNNILTKTTEHGDYTYVYDQLYRIKNVVNPILSDEAYTYDAVGNRMTISGISSRWKYNQNNQLLVYSNITYEYDNNGNMVKKIDGSQVINYIYDEENRLVRVGNEKGNIIAEYYYDPFGRRLWKNVEGIKTYFLFSDEGFLGEYDESGSAIKTYGYRPNSFWMSEPIFVKQNGKYFFFHNDHLGTPQKITDTNNNIVWSAKYHSFGKATIDINTIENNIRFPGQYFDTETGLIQNRYRYYDQNIGRYTQKDIIMIDDVFNHRYVYTSNNPVNFIDLYGLLSFETFFPLIKPIRDVCIQRGLCKPTKDECIQLGLWIDPSSKKHTHRNINNKCPLSKPKPNRIRGGVHLDCKGNKWTLDPNPDFLFSPDYHGYYKGYWTFRGTGYYEGSQCTYDRAGKLIDSGKYMGTFDYGKALTVEHYCKDVLPHEESQDYEHFLTTIIETGEPYITTLQ